MQFKFKRWCFVTTWYTFLFVVLGVACFIKLGLWQYHKAQQKLTIEQTFQKSKAKGMVNLSDYLSKPDELEFQKVRVIGSYAPQYQMLIDNQVEEYQGGFHVVTPFRIKGTDSYVLVNRGWIRGFDDHTQLPAIDTPDVEHMIEGMAWIPTNKIFSLEKPQQGESAAFKPVWQHLDMQNYQKMVPFKVLSIIVKLAPEQPEGGFVRRWEMPPSRIATHMSYAYQWFGFALATLVIYAVLAIRKEEKASHAN